MKWRFARRLRGRHVVVNNPGFFPEHTHDAVYVFAPRINLDSIQSEAGALVSRLAMTTKKVSSSVDEVKEQFTSVLKVRQMRLQTPVRCLLGLTASL